MRGWPSPSQTVKLPKQHPTPGDIPLALRALLTGAASCSQRAVTAPYQLFLKIKLISKRLYVQYFGESSAEISLFTRRERDAEMYPTISPGESVVTSPRQLSANRNQMKFSSGLSLHMNIVYLMHRMYKCWTSTSLVVQLEQTTLGIARKLQPLRGKKAAVKLSVMPFLIWLL